MKPENVKCPDCDGPMISRKSKFGVFWGCKAYPKCKGTRDNEGHSKADRAKERGEEYQPGGDTPEDDMYMRTWGKDRRDKAILNTLMKEVDRHDLKEGQKFSFNKRTR